MTRMCRGFGRVFEFVLIVMLGLVYLSSPTLNSPTVYMLGIFVVLQLALTTGYAVIKAVD